MADARKITVEFIGNDKSLGKTANSIEGKTSSMGSKMQKVGSIAGKALAAGALLAAGGLYKMGQNAADDEAAQRKLATALKNTVGATDSQIKSVEDYISKMSLATGVTDDELRPAFQKLVQATGSVDEAQRQMSIAMDVSAGTGKSLKTVTDALMKANNGTTASLSKLGLKTKDAEGNTLSLDEALGSMSETFKGQAQKQAESTAGKMARFRVSLDELGETIGTMVIPVLDKMAVVGLKVVNWVDKNQTTTAVLIGTFATLTAGIWATSKVLKHWTAITKIARGAQLAFNFVLAANPIGLVIIAIAALAAGLVIAYKKSETFRRIVDGAFRAVATAAAVAKAFIVDKFNAVVGFFEKLPGRISGVAVGMFDGVKNAFKSAVNWIIQKWNDFEISMPSIDTHIPGVGTIGGFSLGTPNIPLLANGGVVTKPTLAVIGEAGPEAVVPLSGRNARGMGGLTLVIQGPVYGDPRAYAQHIAAALRKEKRLAGVALGLA